MGRKHQNNNIYVELTGFALWLETIDPIFSGKIFFIFLYCAI